MRIVEHRRIAICGSQVGDRHLAARNPGAGRISVFARHACGELRGGVQPQNLLDRIRPQLRILAQHRKLIGGVDQHPDAVAQQVHGGFETGRQHQACDPTQLQLIEIPPYSDVLIS